MEDEVVGSNRAAQGGFWLGLVVAATMVVLPPPAALSEIAWHTAALTVLMAIWWSTDAIPLSATALLPFLVLPLVGAVPVKEAGSPYANETIFLILGGFLVGLAMERSRLHQRIAYNIAARFGGNPQRLVFGLMVATAFTSMWVSNTSTTLMMMPVALSVAALAGRDGTAGAPDADARNFASCLVLGVAYAATIGGLGTLVGTPTNALVVGFLGEQGLPTISFVAWMAFGIPTVALLLPVAWYVLTRHAFPFRLADGAAAGQAVREARAGLGPLRPAERRVMGVFIVLAALWIARPWLVEWLAPLTGGASLRITDATLAIAAGLALFAMPAGGTTPPGERLLQAVDLRRVPWDVLLLFGGGLALAAGIDKSGLSTAVGQGLSGLGGLPLALLVLSVVALLVFWTELNSNVAAAATALPVLAAIAGATAHPVLMLVAPAAMAASCGFMLPVGTPPNAIAFGTGHVELRKMLRAGFWLDLAAIGAIFVVAMVVLPWLA